MGVEASPTELKIYCKNNQVVDYLLFGRPIGKIQLLKTPNFKILKTNLSFCGGG